MNKKIASIASIAMALLLAGGVVLATESTGNGNGSLKNAEKKAEIQNKIEEKKADLQEKRQERMERVCTNVEARVRTRLNRFENNKKAHMNVFSNMLTRLQKVVDRFDEAGLNTTELEGYVAKLDSMIDELYADHDIFIGKLEETQDFACGKSEGEFKTKLGESRKVSLEVRTDIVQIREYYKSTVRPEILELRSQWEELNGDEEDDEKSETSEANEDEQEDAEDDQEESVQTQVE